MTFIRSLAGFVVLLLVLSAGTAISAEAGTASGAESAAAAYGQGDYKSAYRQYLKLAKDGDTFAQYRVSYMELMGFGTKADVIEAMAWAVLAAESGQQRLVTYQDAVAAMVPTEQRKKAKSKVDQYLRRWGEGDYGSDRGIGSRYAGGCTGTRLATNCSKGGSAGGKHIAWGEDHSADPAQKGYIEDLNRSIVENAAEIHSDASGG